MYSIEEIKELITTLDNSKLTNLEIVNEKGEKLSLKKKCSENKAQAVSFGVPVVAPNNTTYIDNNQSAEMPKTISNDSIEKSPVESSVPSKTIDCPMVGVFYVAPSPDAEPYVSVGSAVKKGDVICIVEAMKLMNEVTATESGIIKEVLVEDGSLVEFGQPLFVIE